MLKKLALASCLYASFFSTTAFAEVKIIVEKSQQQMRVINDGKRLYTWSVSTGRPGHRTGNGTFGVQWLDADHYSSLYNNAPMPWSIFFNGDEAIHGTTALGKLGTPASHGCVRLSPKNAKILFRLVQKTKDGVSIIVYD